MTLDHWQNIYKTKADGEVSWTQSYPRTAVEYLESLNLGKSANIIDIGGGASNFADALIDLGYQNITVLDISEAALERSRERLGSNADIVNWVVSDINEFETGISYDFWYDRAVFHFLIAENHINNYVEMVSSSINKGGHFLLGTFSEDGPKKCSGLEVTQYSENKMKATFESDFEVNRCFKEEHTTPFNTVQNFQFCGFERR